MGSGARSERVAGADVWRGRWVVVVLEAGRFGGAFVADRMEEVLARLRAVRVVGIDMPIGLPAAGGLRPADEEARRYVGPRWPSVFRTPPAELLEATSHAGANEAATARGWPRISAQAYALRERILEVQPIARGDDRCHEVHPEVSFARANGGEPLRWPKTCWNGVHLRRRILAGQRVLLPDELEEVGAAGSADVLDAAAVAWSAGRIAAGEAVSMPAGAARIGAIWS